LAVRPRSIARTIEPRRLCAAAQEDAAGGIQSIVRSASAATASGMVKPKWMASRGPRKEDPIRMRSHDLRKMAGHFLDRIVRENREAAEPNTSRRRRALSSWFHAVVG
jgi:hypothetical protein